MSNKVGSIIRTDNGNYGIIIDYLYISLYESNLYDIFFSVSNEMHNCLMENCEFIVICKYNEFAAMLYLNDKVIDKWKYLLSINKY